MTRSAKVISEASAFSGPFKDWGAVPNTVEGESRMSGVVLHKDEEGGEAGLWICTPGRWRCEVTRDEFCHFLSGHCVYAGDSGEVIRVSADTTIFFPAGWTGECRVSETVRKVYMIR